MFIFQIDAMQILIGENKKKDISQTVDNPESVLLKSLFKTPESDGVEATTQETSRQIKERLLGHIMDLTNEYITYAKEHQNFFRGNEDTLDADRHIMLAPPWENSNDLFETLSQYSGIETSDENVANVKSFFYKIMRNRPADPNNDGAQDYKDILSIWGANDIPKPVTKGDINSDGKVDQSDLRELAFDLRIGDMNHDGKLDQEDYEILQRKIDSPPILLRELDTRPSLRWLPGDLNHDGKINKEDLDMLGHVLKAGDMDGNGKVDREDIVLLRKQIYDGDSGFPPTPKPVPDPVIHPFPQEPFRR